MKLKPVLGVVSPHQLGLLTIVPCAEYTEDGVLKFTRTVLLQLKKVFKAVSTSMLCFVLFLVSKPQIHHVAAVVCCSGTSSCPSSLAARWSRCNYLVDWLTPVA